MSTVVWVIVLVWACCFAFGAGVFLAEVGREPEPAELRDWDAVFAPILQTRSSK